VITPEQYAAYRAAQAAGASAVEAGGVAVNLGLAVELAQARDAHGRFTSEAAQKAHDTASLHAHETASRDAKAKLAADRAKREAVYRGRQHEYKAGSLHLHPGGERTLPSLQARAARVTAAQQRAFNIAREGTVSRGDLQRAMVESKVYTASEVAGMQQQISELKARLDAEDNEKARGILASHIGMVVAGGLIAAALSGVGLPALVAAGVTMMPGISQELIDFHAVEKGRGRRFLAHPVQETRHAYQALRHKLPAGPESPLLKPRPVRSLTPRPPLQQL
jgi:hypothetical protein